MKRKTPDPLLRLVESFFREYLQRVRGSSRHTILAYRDTLRLFLSFVAQARQRPVANLRLEDLTVDQVLAFLDYLESDRKNTVATRNCRLACIRSFFRHLIQHEPTHAGQYQRVLSLPLKKKKAPTICYLEPEEMGVVLRQPDQRTLSGLRDYALLLFLYNTGARIGETLTVRREHIQFVRPRQVHLHGKGRKDRICPLWRNTAAVLRRLAERSDLLANEHIFRNARGQPLSRDGAAYIVHKYSLLASKERQSIRRKHVTPHVFRHSCAVALLQAGVDLVVIRDYLGHESIATTGRYTRTNLKLKRKVMEAFWHHAGIPSKRANQWHPAPDLLAFLSSL